MTIINRDKNITEQKEWIQWNNDFGVGAVGQSSLVQSGQTLLIAGPMPYPGRLQSGEIFATGVTTAMQISLSLQRFIGPSGPGTAGFTNITVGISNMVLQNVSVSGPLGFSGFPAANSTLLLFQAGDCFMLTTSGANGAASSVAINLVVIKTQDIVSHNLIFV